MLPQLGIKNQNVHPDHNCHLQPINNLDDSRNYKIFLLLLFFLLTMFLFLVKPLSINNFKFLSLKVNLCFGIKMCVLYVSLRLKVPIQTKFNKTLNFTKSISTLSCHQESDPNIIQELVLIPSPVLKTKFPLAIFYKRFHFQETMLHARDKKL